MKHGQISRCVACTVGITPLLEVDFVRHCGRSLLCYAGPKQIATVPANATHDLLCSMGLDLDILRMVREEELAQAKVEAGLFDAEVLNLRVCMEACLAAGEAGQAGLELIHLDIDSVREEFMQEAHASLVR